MDVLFWYRIGLSFLIGGAWVTLSTLASERYGSMLGGLLGGLPSTVVVSLLFIGITQTPLVASEATTIIPLTMGVNGLFMLTYLFLVRRGLVMGLGGALLVWLFLARLLLTVGIRQFWMSISIWVLLVIGCYLIAEKVMQIPKVKQVSVDHTFLQIILRTLFSGMMIAFAVYMGKAKGPAYGGVFASFPALFLSTLVITYRTGGVTFSRAVAKPLMLSAMINVTLYTIVVRYAYAWMGLLSGTAIALASASLFWYLTYRLLRAKLS